MISDIQYNYYNIYINKYILYNNIVYKYLFLELYEILIHSQYRNI